MWDGVHSCECMLWCLDGDVENESKPSDVTGIETSTYRPR
jgi:hypothetical protein